MNGWESTFRGLLAGAGIPWNGKLAVDGQVHRFKTDGDKTENCWYVLRGTGEQMEGAFGCWKRNFVRSWRNLKGGLKPEGDWQKDREAEAQNRRELERKNHLLVSRSVKAMIARCPPVALHGYLTRKGVAAHGDCRVSDAPATAGWLTLPLVDGPGWIWSAQFIAEDGTKRFSYQGRVQGCWFELSARADGPLVVCEGYATGASIYEATGAAVICAMNCGNLKPAAEELRKKFPGRQLVIAADDDCATDGNPGITKATAAAAAVDALLVFPMFNGRPRLNPPTDFNDLHRLCGLDEVRRQLNFIFSVANPVPAGNI